MAFTYVTLQRTYETADDQPARGTVTFTPIDQMVNGLTVVSGPNVATLDTAGAISKRLAATTDPATTPVGVTYRVVEQIVGQLTRTYYVSVPHNAGSTLNLADLTVIVPGAASGFALRNAADYDDSVAPTDGQVMTWDSTTSKFHPEPGGGGTGAVSSVNGATGAVTITASGLGAQPIDTDLTAFAALAPADGSFLGRTAGAWAGRTAAQTKTDLALDQVSNTSDAAKPLSTAATTALAAKAPLASPTFTGTPAAPRFVGAVQIVTYASSVTLDAAVATTFRVAATGPLTVTDITNGTNGQEIWLEVLASGADRVVTVAGAATTVAAGGWWIRSLRYDQPLDTWKLVEIGGTSNSGSGGIPDDGSVTNAKVATTAAITLDKTVDSATRLAMTSTERATLTGLTERVQDDAAALLTAGVHTGLIATYVDASNRVDLAVTGSAGGAAYGGSINPTLSPYNAVGNGSTDDTTALQSALTALDTQGYGVLDLGGRRYVTGRLSVKPNTGIVNGTLIAKASLNDYVVSLDGHATRYQTGWRLENLAIDGNKGSNATSAGAVLVSATGALFDRPLIRNVRITNCKGTGVRLVSSSSTIALIQPRLEHVTVDMSETASGSIGVYVGTAVYDGSFVSVDVGRCHRGLVIEGTLKQRCTDVRTWGCADVGTMVVDSKDVTFVNHECDNNLGHGAYIYNSTVVHFLGSAFSNNAFVDTNNEFGYGAGFNSAAANTKDGAFLDQNSAVYFSACRFVNEEATVGFRGEQRYGVQAANGASGRLSAGCVFRDNRTGTTLGSIADESPNDPLNVAVPLAERIQFGVYANAGGTAAHAALETTLGVRIPRYVTYQVMGTGGTSAWPTTHADWCKLTGHDLTIAWDILSGGPTFATILSGGNNASIDAFFTAAKNYGGPVTLRMWWEMNDANGPTKVDNVSSTLFASSTVSVRRQQWIDAWRYVYNRCKTTVGASNVEFFFCANGSDTGATTVEQLWPGEQYVDVVGLDTYNETSFASWTSFSTKIAPMMNRLATLAPNLPQGIGEIGTVDTGGPAGTSKATWLQDMFATADWPKLRFVDYFSVNQTNDWRLDQTPAAITAVQTWVPRTRSGLDIDDNTGSGGGSTTDTVARAIARAGLLAVDTFSRADGALGTTESGQTWELQTGSPTIDGGQATATAAFVAAVDVGRADVDVEATIIPQSGTSGSLLFRVGPTSADRLAIALDTTNGFRLNKTDTNVLTALATTAFTFSAGIPYRVRVIADGSSIAGYLNGELLLSHTLVSGDQTKYGAYTKVGIRQTGTTAVRFDDFTVRPAYPAPSGGGIPTGAQVVYVATGDDSDLTAALASAPVEAVLVAVKVAGT